MSSNFLKLPNELSTKLLIILFSFLPFPGTVAFSQPSTPSRDRALYLTQIKAAEASLRLNEIRDARELLQATNPDLRGYEWQLLQAMSDRSVLTFAGNKNPLAGIALSPDRKTLACGSSDSTIFLYNAENGSLLGILKGHKAQVTSLDFSPDGSQLLSGSEDKTICLWNPVTQKLISKISHPFFRGIYQVKFSPDGKTAAAASWEFLPKQSPPVQGFAVVMSLPQGEIIQRINTDNHPASSVDFSISGEKLITATWGFYVKQHDIKSGKDDWTYDLNDIGYYAAFQSCDVSPDGNRIVTGGKDNQVRMLDAATGKLLYLIQPHMGHSKWVNAVRFSGDGKLFASGSDDQLIKVWESASGKLVATLNGHTHNINGLVFSNDNTTLYSSSSDGTIKKWDIRKSGHRQIAVCKSGPWYAPVSDDGKWLVAACSDSSTLLWDLEAGTAAMDVKGRAISGAISPDNRYAAAGNREIYLLDLEKKKHVATVKGHTKTIYGMDWLRSKNFLATASDDRTVRIWNEKGDSVNMIRVNTGSPYSVVFSPDQRSMYVGMTNGLIKKYNTSNWQETDSLKPGKDLANLRIDPSGQYLLTCGQKGQLYLWNIAQRKIRALEGHTNHIYGIAFHPDGKYAISVSYDQSLKLWDLASGQCVLTLKEFTGELYTISITNKGKRIIAGQTDGVVHILDF